MNSQARGILGVLALLVIGLLVWGLATMPDHRSTGQRIGDAVDALPNVGKAADQLQDRTPGQKVGDAVKDAGQDIKDNTAR